MTEVKWGILFVGIFLCLILGVEYKITLVETLIGTGNNLNCQLDTCLDDTLEEASYIEGEGLTFAHVESVVALLQRNLEKAFSQWIIDEKAFMDRIVLLVFYEEDGFYLYSGKNAGVSEKISYEKETLEQRIFQMEKEMEKRSNLSFTFPTIEEEPFANSLEGTGVFMVFRAPVQMFSGRDYERLVISGAKVEKSTRENREFVLQY